jgi:hypothetical protein
MRITEIAYNIAVPAPKMDIFKYILTGGKFGKLFVSKEVKANKYWSEYDPRTMSVNCRCSMVLPKKESK